MCICGCVYIYILLFIAPFLQLFVRGFHCVNFTQFYLYLRAYAFLLIFRGYLLYYPLVAEYSQKNRARLNEILCEYVRLNGESSLVLYFLYIATNCVTKSTMHSNDKFAEKVPLYLIIICMQCLLIYHIITRGPCACAAVSKVYINYKLFNAV